MKLWEITSSYRLDELLDQPYTWEWSISNSVGSIAEFDTDNDTIEVSLSFGQDQDGSDVVDLMFESKTGGLKITNNGNAFKIFSTVADITRAFFKTHELKPIRFSAKESSRVKLYQRLSKMMANELGWSVREDKKPGRVVFIVGPSSDLKEWGLIVPNVNTTVDVQPGEIQVQAAKFGNILDSKGRPPLLCGSYGDDTARYSANQGDPLYGPNGTKLNRGRQ